MRSSADLVILGVGVVAVSTAAVLIREASAPALVIAAYRLTLASLPLLLFARLRREPVILSDRRHLALGALAGLFLALHFAFWIASVQKTSIVTSVVLVTAQPLLVALASGPILHERPGSATWAGIAIATSGALVMVANDLGGGESLLGDLYAVLGALFTAGYLLIARKVQLEGQSWLGYVTLAYSVAAVIAVAIAAGAGEPFFGYSTHTYAILLLLALVPQLIGHTALNVSLGRLPATTVTIAILGEPVGATLLAYLVLDEAPDAFQLAGGVLVLLGVYVGLRPQPARV